MIKVRSVSDFARFMEERARLNGWELVVLDLGVDTSKGMPETRTIRDAYEPRAEAVRDDLGGMAGLAREQDPLHDGS